MQARPIAAVAIAALALLGACSKGADDQSVAANAGAPAVAGDTAPAGVTRNVVEPPPAQTPAPTPAAIQTQPGPKGSQVALNRVAVTGDILTVALTYQGTSCCAYVPVDQVSIIDDATSQRLSVLKDNAGHWMAAPFDSGTALKELRIGTDGASTQVWFKFPAPPPTSKTISLTIPGVAPFDGIPITR